MYLNCSAQKEISGVKYFFFIYGLILYHESIRFGQLFKYQRHAVLIQGFHFHQV